jgi:AcrR family transcriptional regulator
MKKLQPMPLTRRTKASQKTKNKILQTTMQLLLKKGSSEATSTTDICSAADITRPTLYHYFGNKRHLIFSVHMNSIATTLRPYIEYAASINDPLERLKYIVRTYTKTLMCLHPELRVLIHDALTIKDRHFREVRSEWKKHYLLIKDTIGQLKSEGMIETDMKSSWAALFVLGMLTWTTYWFDYNRKGEVDGIAEAALHFVFHGVGLKVKLL